MNAPNTWMNEEDSDHGATMVYARREQSRETRMRHHTYGRRSRPSSSNGIHRRRNKRVSW